MVNTPGRHDGPNFPRKTQKLAIPGAYISEAGNFVPQVIVNREGLNVGFSRFSLDVKSSGLANLSPGARSFPYIRNGRVMIEVRNEKGHKVETLPREATGEEAADYIKVLNEQVLQPKNLTSVARESGGSYFIEMRNGKAELFEVSSASPAQEASTPGIEERKSVRDLTRTLLDTAREEEGPTIEKAGEMINFMIEELTDKSVVEVVGEVNIIGRLQSLKEEGIKVPAEDFQRIFATASQPLASKQKLRILEEFGRHLSGEEVAIVTGMASKHTMYQEEPEFVRPQKPNKQGVRGKLQKLGVEELGDTMNFGRDFGLTCEVDGMTRHVACTDGKLYYYGNPNVPHSLGGVTKTPLTGAAKKEAERKLEEFLSDAGFTLAVTRVMVEDKFEDRLIVVGKQEDRVSLEDLAHAYRNEVQELAAARREEDEEAPTDPNVNESTSFNEAVDLLEEKGVYLGEGGVVFVKEGIIPSAEMDLPEHTTTLVQDGFLRFKSSNPEERCVVLGSLVAAYLQEELGLPPQFKFKVGNRKIYLDMPSATDAYRPPADAVDPASKEEELRRLRSWKEENGYSNPSPKERPAPKLDVSHPLRPTIEMPLPPAPPERTSEMSGLGDFNYGEFGEDDAVLRTVNSFVTYFRANSLNYSIGSGRLFYRPVGSDRYERVDDPAAAKEGLRVINEYMSGRIELGGPSLSKIIFDLDPEVGSIKAYDAGDMPVGEILEELDYCGIQVEKDGSVTLNNGVIDGYEELDGPSMGEQRNVGVVNGKPVLAGEDYEKESLPSKEGFFTRIYGSNDYLLKMSYEKIVNVLNRRFVTQRLAKQNVLFVFDEEEMNIKVSIHGLEDGVKHAGVPAAALGEVALAGAGFEGADLLTQYRKGLVSWPGRKDVAQVSVESVEEDSEEVAGGGAVEPLSRVERVKRLFVTPRPEGAVGGGGAESPISPEGADGAGGAEEDVRAAASEVKEEVPSFRPEDFGKRLAALKQEDVPAYWQTFDQDQFSSHYGFLLKDGTQVRDFLSVGRENGVLASLTQRKAKKLVLQMMGFDKVPSHADFVKNFRRIRAFCKQEAAGTDEHEAFMAEYFSALEILRDDEAAYNEFFADRIEMPTGGEWKAAALTVLAGWYGLRTARLGLGAFVSSVAGFGSRVVRTVSRPFAVAGRRFARATAGSATWAYRSFASQIQRDESEITGGFFARQWEKAKRNTAYAGKWAFNRSAAVVAAGMIALPGAAYGTVDAAVTLPVATVASFAGLELMPKGGEAAAEYVTVDRIADSCAAVLGADSDEMKEIKKQKNNAKAIEAAMTVLAAKGVEDPEKFLQNAGMLALEDEGKRGFFDRIRRTDKVGVIASTKALGRGAWGVATAPIRGLDIAPVHYLRTKGLERFKNIDPNDLVRVRDVLKKVGPDFENALAEQEAKHPGETIMNFFRAFERLPDEYIDALSKAGLDFANVGLMGQLLPEILKWHSHKTHPEKKYDNYKPKLAGMGTALPKMDDLEYKAFVGNIDLSKMAAEYAPLMGGGESETLAWLNSHSQNKKVARHKIAQFFGEDSGSTPIRSLLINKINKVFDALVARPSESEEERILKEMIDSMLRFVANHYDEIYSA